MGSGRSDRSGRCRALTRLPDAIANARFSHETDGSADDVILGNGARDPPREPLTLATHPRCTRAPLRSRCGYAAGSMRCLRASRDDDFHARMQQCRSAPIASGRTALEDGL